MTAPSAHVKAMVETVRSSERAPVEKAESLVEVAFDLQKKPRSAQDLWDALFLCDEARAFAADDRLGLARVHAARGAALRRMPSTGPVELEAARDAFEAALPVLRDSGDPEERAEVEMSYGLCLQSLAAFGRANLNEAVQAYHRALKFFTKEKFAREHAILHNNLATAYLSLRMAPEREGLREALAVQSFQEALAVVTIDSDPTEYAMLQNNLGNALQALRSSHPFENLARALVAYDESLKVRTARDMPIEHANTISNKANALMNLPDEPEHPERGNPKNLREAARLLGMARDAFQEHGYPDRVGMVQEILTSIEADLTKGSV